MDQQTGGNSGEQSPPSSGSPLLFTEELRGGYDHGRYIALMDLTHFLGNEHVEALLPVSDDANLPISVTPTMDTIGSTLVEIPTTSTRHMVVEQAADSAETPPAPPLPHMMKNLLKDRRRFQRQLVTTNAGHPPQQQAEVDRQIMEAAHRNMENYLLKQLFEQEETEEPNEECAEFSRELLYATMTQCANSTEP